MQPTTRIRAIALALILLGTATSYAQNNAPNNKPQQKDESYGNTLNLGIGIGYYGQSAPFFMASYEFNVARNFTLSPFIGISSYRSYDDYYYGGNHYYYHETIVPIGVKGTYYFDRLLNLNPKWDIYLAASLGYVFDNVVWDDGYYGDRSVANSVSNLYLAGHIGAEYHITRRTGLFLDLSTGISTFGLAFHHR